MCSGSAGGNFLAPRLAEMIIAKGEEGVLESHRRDIVVVFCDLRGYTAFTATAGALSRSRRAELANPHSP